MSEDKDDLEDVLDELVLPEVVVPEFKSDLPGYVADGLTPKEKYVLEALSIIGKKQDFTISVVRSNREQMNRLASITRITYRRTKRYEKLILILTSKWSVVVYLIAALYPILSNKLIQRLWP